jgi:uncharacterized protein (TIGR02598 family)
MLRRQNDAGFSLIECAHALGVVGFAFVTLVGLIPVGLNTFHSAIDATVGSQIAQGLLTEARQAKFSELANFDKNVDVDPTKPIADYYYDDEGNTTPATTKENHIYDAAVQVFYASKFEVGVPTAELKCDPAVAQFAVVRVIVRRISAPNQTREFTGFIANNGM